ncbi:sulfate transporter family-domain-containing protein, partial [Thamnocephalis sphaerospora]
PIVGWLPRYNRRWFAGDLLAGLTVGILLVPQSLAYAKLAGMPIETGLYGALIGTLLYTFMGTSKDINMGPVAVLALYNSGVVRRVVEEYADHRGSLSNAQLAAAVGSTLSFFAGLLVLILGLLRLGMVLDFVSNPAMIGVITGAGLTVFASQLPSVIGVPNINNRNSPYRVIYDTLAALPTISWPDLVVGLTTVGCLIVFKYLGQRYGKRSPIVKSLSLARMPITFFLFTLMSFIVSRFEPYAKAHPFSIVRNVPSGMPKPEVPKLDWDFVQLILPSVPIAAVISVVEHVAIAKDLGRKSNYQPDCSQELITIGTINTVSPFFRGFISSGAIVRTAVNNQAGARSPLTSFICFLIVGAAILFLPPAFFYVPNSSLAGVIIMVVPNLVRGPAVFRRLWRIEPTDFFAAIFAVVIIFFTSIETGIAVAVGFSLLVLLYRFARPKHSALEQLRDAPTQYVDRRDPKYDTVPPPPGIVIFRLEGALLYPNSEYVQQKIVNLVLGSTRSASEETGAIARDASWSNDMPQPFTKLPPLRRVILDFSEISQIDTSGLQMLLDLRDELARYTGLGHFTLHFVAV